MTPDNKAGKKLLVLCAAAMLLFFVWAPPPGSAVSGSAGRGASPKHDCRPNVGYFILAHARLITPSLVYVRGASNLPPGSVLFVSISNYIGEGSATLNNETRVSVGKDGLFDATVHAKRGMEFRTNMICDVSFGCDPRAEPPAVIGSVGRRGERLGTLNVNPQVYQSSGGHYLDEVTVIQE